jgi:hypothetical protein
MDRYELGDKVSILHPFGDEKTIYEISSIQGIGFDGEVSNDKIDYYQYEIEGVFYADKFLKRVS